MTVNNGGKLSKEYFSAYLSLVMNANQCSVLLAKEYMEEHFFKNNIDTFGKYTYSNFLKAVKEIS
ncbi:hypothetical protein U1P98_04570 [Lysinibacillus irui]|uniref:Uncharacterized protein n=1 Tax=Lysinibacillus irui TaxID=2998077 RepID=A0ABU5NHR1_9BACI|nr:hypothetical protein [Lysinibacillus irui]MEA0552984.1 hypothetical protein [Lysinibacillus irui]MEA0975564.1 hypothetical protein [Lysinibacillus irui]MEA1041718.1 hypothetical protein [Lysinibacillus irui]